MAMSTMLYREDVEAKVGSRPIPEERGGSRRRRAFPGRRAVECFLASKLPHLLIPQSIPLKATLHPLNPFAWLYPFFAMSFPGGETSSSIPKPFGSTSKLVSDVNRAFALPVPAFGDLGKAANDVSRKSAQDVNTIWRVTSR